MWKRDAASRHAPSSPAAGAMDAASLASARSSVKRSYAHRVITAHTAVAALNGIGHAKRKLLHAAGIGTVGELAALTDDKIVALEVRCCGGVPDRAPAAASTRGGGWSAQFPSRPRYRSRPALATPPASRAAGEWGRRRGGTQGPFPLRAGAPGPQHAAAGGQRGCRVRSPRPQRIGWVPSHLHALSDPPLDPRLSRPPAETCRRRAARW